MPFPRNTTYPATATNAAWQKKKSLLDKNVKTKLGPALLIAADKWGDIKFADLKVPNKWSTVEAAQTALKKAQAAYPAVITAKNAVKNAHKIATTWSTSTKLNKASREALKVIAKDLQDAHDRLDLMDDIIPSLSVDVSITTKEAAVAKRQKEHNARLTQMAQRKHELVAKRLKEEEAQKKIVRKQEARKKLSKVSVYSGKTPVYRGGSGTLVSNGTYEIKGGEDAGFTTMTNLLKQKVNVEATDADGDKYQAQMTLVGYSGAYIRLKP